MEKTIYVSGKLPTYPSPKPTLCFKWEVIVNVGLGEEQVGSFPEKYDDPQLLPGRRVILPAESTLASVHMRKKISLLCPSQQLSRMLRLPRLNRDDLAGQAEVLIWRNLGPTRRVTLPKGGHRAVTLLAKPSFCSSCKLFATFCKEIYK